MIRKLCMNFHLKYKWIKELKKADSISSKTISIENVKEKTLFIVPHADDELLAAFNLIKRLDPKHLIIYYCGMTGGNHNTDNKSKRDREIQRFCIENGFTVYCPANWKKELRSFIADNNIKTIFLPSFIDWHPEHREINDIFYENIILDESALLFYWYSITVPIVSDKALLVPMSRKEQRRKYEAFIKYYKSQNNLPTYRFRIHERINARNIDAFAAEIFYPVTGHVVRKIQIELDELNSLKTIINNVFLIRSKSNSFYSLIDCGLNDI